MRLVRSSFDACENARELVSLQLDDELAELDRARLDGHLDRCPACRAFAADLGATASTLRGAPLEPVRFRVSVPRRRLVSIRAMQAAAAAAAVALVAGLSALSSLTAREASVPSVKLGLHATDRGDELVPGKVRFRISPQRVGDRIAL
jgi:predicted anti-sigma-YlaC factor YlaD